MKIDKTITGDNVNQNILRVEYAVRGRMVQRAVKIERELEKGVKKPFNKVVRANIGDCQALGQKPITFIRQVLALAACPQLLEVAAVPQDVKDRVREVLADCTRGSVGAYSPSPGLPLVRQKVAEYLAARDGLPASAEDIYLGSGCSDVIKAVLAMFVEDVEGKPPGVMIPCPQYPLFSGTLTELGMQQVDYFLDEDHDWELSVEELKRAWREANQHTNVRAIVIINPGNPTGQVLSVEKIEEIVKFAYEHNLFLLADEVYQDNIVEKPFVSFKKVMHDMGSPYNTMELASFITGSKGWAGECGLRCGLVELLRLAPDVLRAFDTQRALAQCPSVLGQFLLHCVAKPPAPGEPSYELFVREKAEIHRTLCDRTAAAQRLFNQIPGYFCNRIEAAMFAFPRYELPARAQAAAREAGLEPDEFYCVRLLEQTGVCVVPGSGFGQRPGTFHFRTTIVHPPDEFQYMMEAFHTFHVKFLQTYS